jgi:DNA-binding IclR family transcriptional regulator
VDILNLFEPRTPELGTTEIAEATGLHKSTAAGLIYTLTAKGYLTQNPTNRKYRLGLKLVERAAIVLGSMDLRQAALPVLQRLRDAFDEAVNLAVLDEAHMVYVERVLGTRALGMRSEVGKREPAHTTALGKAIFACWAPAEVAAFVERFGLHPLTARTVTDPAVFMRQVDDARRLGYALDDEENEEGGRCVAAAVLDHTGRPVAALSISAPTARLPLEDVPAVGAKVQEAALAISASLGYAAR